MGRRDHKEKREKRRDFANRHAGNARVSANSNEGEERWSHVRPGNEGGEGKRE